MHGALGLGDGVEVEMGTLALSQAKTTLLLGLGQLIAKLQRKEEPISDIDMFPKPNVLNLKSQMSIQGRNGTT